jgi:hypothetical protein
MNSGLQSSQDPSSQHSQKQSSSSGFDFDDEPVQPAKDAHIRKKVQQPARPGFDRPITKLNIDKEHKPVSSQTALDRHTFGQGGYLCIPACPHAHDC